MDKEVLSGMLRKFTESFIILLFILFISTGCGGDYDEKQYLSEIDSLKKEMEALKDSIGQNEQMRKEIDYLKEEIEQLKAEKDTNLEASLYSCIVGEADIELTVDIKKENGADRDISFIVLSSNTENQRISGGHSVISYDEVVIPGKGVIGTDDVPEGVKRYRIVFPVRDNYVYYIVAIDKGTGSLWNYEINSGMEGDI
jgi:hypothetical protein